MNVIATITQITITSGKRILQFIGMGKIPYTGSEYMPYGIDSAPIEGTPALYADTSNRDVRVISGYKNQHQKALPGEFRCYATDADGNVTIDLYMRNDGSMEIGGNANHMTQWEALNQGLATYFANQNTAIEAGIASAGGTYTAPAALDISAARLNDIKTA